MYVSVGSCINEIWGVCAHFESNLREGSEDRDLSLWSESISSWWWAMRKKWGLLTIIHVNFNMWKTVCQHGVKLWAKIVTGGHIGSVALIKWQTHTTSFTQVSQQVQTTPYLCPTTTTLVRPTLLILLREWSFWKGAYLLFIYNLFTSITVPAAHVLELERGLLLIPLLLLAHHPLSQESPLPLPLQPLLK